MSLQIRLWTESVAVQRQRCRCGWHPPLDLTSVKYAKALLNLHQDSCPEISFEDRYLP